jgi:hypothetical protein
VVSLRSPRRPATEAAGSSLRYCHAAAIVVSGADPGAIGSERNAPNCGPRPLGSRTCPRATNTDNVLTHVVTPAGHRRRAGCRPGAQTGRTRRRQRPPSEYTRGNWQERLREREQSTAGSNAAIIVSGVDPGPFRRQATRRTTTLGRGRCSRPRSPCRARRAAGPPAAAGTGLASRRSPSSWKAVYQD